MKLLLNDFEQIIDKSILNRGYLYFQNGNVVAFDEISDGQYQAIVQGSEEYEIFLEVINDVLVDYSCDCPYDAGPFCKHIVASIFLLRGDDFYLEEETKIVKNNKNISSKKKLDSLLKKISTDELHDFIKDHSTNNTQFQSIFFSYFSYYSEDQSKEFYRKQIRTIVDTASDKYGFIYWEKVSTIENGIDPLIQAGYNNIENKNYKVAITICTAVIEEMISTIQYCDDNRGIVGEYVDNSFDMLQTICLDVSDVKIKDELFDYFISAFKNDFFKGWEWHFDILTIAYSLGTSKKEIDIIITCLDSLEDTFYKNSAEVFKLNILRENMPEKVDAYIKKHLSNSTIRNNEITEAIKNEQFKRAIDLCKDGIKNDQDSRPGLVVRWYDRLLEIAFIQKETNKIIEYARYRLLNNYSGSKDFYSILKQNINPDDWNDFLENIIDENNQKGHWQGQMLIRDICINEEWWPRLLLLLQQSPSLEKIADNEKYLAQDYSQELIELYSDKIKLYLDRNTGRGNYKTACRYLRRIKKLGGKDEVSFLINHFKEKYPRRRALIEELDRV